MHDTTLHNFGEVDNYLWKLPKGKIQEIAEKEGTPIWMVNVCHALYKHTARGGAMNALQEVIHLLFNKKQATKSSTPTTNPDCQ